MGLGIRHLASGGTRQQEHLNLNSYVLVFITFIVMMQKRKRSPPWLFTVQLVSELDNFQYSSPNFPLPLHQRGSYL